MKRAIAWLVDLSHPAFWLPILLVLGVDAYVDRSAIRPSLGRWGYLPASAGDLHPL